LSISGVIDPGARAAAVAAGEKPRPKVGVIATEATIRSGAYDKAIRRRRLHALVISRATPLLVPIIEEGRDANDPLVRLALKQYLHPLMERGIDVLVLGCTHYPILKEMIAEIVGSAVPVIDSAEQCAADVAARLRTLQLLRLPLDDQQFGDFNSFVTDDPLRFQKLGSRLLGLELPEPTLISTDQLSQIAQAQQPTTSWSGEQLRAV
jgi:glutamate racemase